MLEVLRAVQIARLRGEPARRISFRDIDVEQIGYIYEGLLGYSCADVNEITVGLIGKEGEEPEIPLAALEALRAAQADRRRLRRRDPRLGQGTPDRRHPADQGRPRQGASEIKRADPGRGRRPGPARRHHRPGAAGPAPALHRHHPPRPAQPAHGRRSPAACSWSRRRPARPRARTTRPSRSPRTSSGTPSSPSSTTRVPHQRVDGWVPVDSDRILELKVADIACGSGAFLVAAARYLADRLVEAWQRERSRHRRDAARAEDPRDPHRHRQLPVRRRHQRDGRGDVQALALAGLARPEAPVLLRRRQDPARQLAARPHRRPPAQAPAHRPRRGRQCSRACIEAGRGRRAQAGQAAPPATRHRGQRQRPAALGDHQAAPVAAVPGGHRPARGDRRRGDRGRAQARRQARQGAQRRLREPVASPSARPTTADESGPDACSTRSSRRASPRRWTPTTTAGSRCTGSSPCPT